MELHHLLATTSIRSMTGLTAFSALPDAPVLADRPSFGERWAAAFRTIASHVPTVVRRRPVVAFAEGAADGAAGARMAECRV